MRAVFLDKDGTLIDDVPYNVDPEQIRLSRCAIEGLLVLQQCGFSLFVVSNQSGIAKGLFTVRELDRAWRTIVMLLAAHMPRAIAANRCRACCIVQPMSIGSTLRSPG